MYLGHVVYDKGIQTDPKKVEVIQKWLIPTNATEVHSFLGFTTIVAGSSGNMHR